MKAKVPKSDYAAIVQRWRDGETLEAIGSGYGVTREFIRQIVKRVDPKLVIQRRKEIQRRQEDAAFESSRRDVLQDYFANGGKCKHAPIERILCREIPTDPTELASWLHGEYHISFFGDLIHCFLCKSVKAAGDFSPSARKPGSVQRMCRACNAERTNAYYHRTGGEYNKQWAKANPHKVRKAGRDYYHRNREVRLEWCRDYYARIKSDPDKYAELLAKARERYHRNKEPRALRAPRETTA